MVTKLKTKLTTPVKILISFIVGLVFCYLLYYLIDVVLNGFIVNWFTDNFTYTREGYDLNGNLLVITDIKWYAVKYMGFTIMIVLTALISVLLVAVSHYYARRRVGETITQTGRCIHFYMTNDNADATEVFPAEYIELSAQMVQLKAFLQQQQQTLQEEARRKDDLITYLAHDLKTPLTSIIGYLSLLDEIPEMPSKQRQQYVGITLDKANRLEDLTNEFFEIIRYNLQQIIIEKEPIDLQYMLIQMTDEFYPLLSVQNNTIELNTEENLTVYGDSAKLARVFNNILKNAIAYSYPDTMIKVTAVLSGQQAVISFENRGKTIPAQKLASIFEKFYRLDEARATNSGGAGLGLAIAKDIVTLHEGEITVTSENETTIFQVKLPRLG